jgi:hypothetical protein
MSIYKTTVPLDLFVVVIWKLYSDICKIKPQVRFINVFDYLILPKLGYLYYSNKIDFYLTKITLKSSGGHVTPPEDFRTIYMILFILINVYFEYKFEYIFYIFELNPIFLHYFEYNFV